jgi:hypothetical protein
MTHDDQQMPDLLAGLRNGAWLDAQTFPALAYAVPGVIPEGSTMLVGAPKIGKSWFVLACALAVAVGGRAIGVLPVDKRPVLYLALEDGHRRLQSRCRILLGDDHIPPGFEYLTFVEPGQVFVTIEAWMARYPNDSPLVILDTLGKVMPPTLPGESSYQRDYRIGSTIKRLADAYPGSSILVNHHDRKAESEDFVDSVSGTHGLAGAADTIITLTRPRLEESGLLKVTGRDIAEGEYAVTFNSNSAWKLDGTSLAEAARNAAVARITSGIGDQLVEVIAHVGKHPAGVKPAELAEALDMDPKQAQVYLSRAYKAKRLNRPSYGLYTPVGSVGSVGVADQEAFELQHSNRSNTPTRGSPHLAVTADCDAS